jgi:GntR family transcriptional regulator
MDITSNNSIPLYYKIENILRERINSGKYMPGDSFPPEMQLAEEFKVSRITIRQALSALAQDGLIFRQRGKGTIVAEELEENQPTRLTGSIEDILAIGLKSKVRLLDLDFVKAMNPVAESLMLESDQQPLRAEKIRYIGGEPFSHVVNYVPPWIGKQIDRKFIEKIPLLEILEKNLQINIGYGHQTIVATIADPNLSNFLQIMVGAPLLKIQRIVYDVNHNPVEYVIVHYRADRYSYSVRLKRSRSDPEGVARWEPKRG